MVEILNPPSRSTLACCARIPPTPPLISEILSRACCDYDLLICALDCGDSKGRNDAKQRYQDRQCHAVKQVSLRMGAADWLKPGKGVQDTLL
jgi:hypothetical protein